MSQPEPSREAHSRQPIPIKQCPRCRIWLSDQDLLAGAEVEPLGLQAYIREKTEAVYFFNHRTPLCGTTFVVPVRDLAHLVDEIIPMKINTLLESCEGHCVDLSDHRPCEQTCFFAPFRRLLAKMYELRRQTTPVR